MIQKMASDYKQDFIEPHIKQTYTIVEKISSGAYGHVWKIKHKKNNSIFALKKIFLAFQNDVDAQRTFRQISILKKIQHPNIVKLKEVIKAENNLDLYLVFQYVECDLFTAVKDGVLNEVHRKYIIFQIAKTLKFLHSAGILHRDLKPSNILLDSSCKIKICDFGLSRTLFHYDNREPVMTQFIATRWYRAPEVLFGSKNYSYPSDMWSLGCLIYELYAEKPLIPGDDSINQIQKLLQFKGFPTKDESTDLNVSKLEVLLSHFKTKKHPIHFFYKPNWESSLIELLNGLLTYSPKERWNNDRILQCQFLSKFHNFQPILTSPSQIKISVNENTKKEKDFYKNLIYKFFTKEKKESKGVLNSFHHSSLPSHKKKLSLSKRKTYKNSISLHSKLPCGMDKQFISTNSSFRKKKSMLKMLGQKILNRSHNDSSPYKPKEDRHHGEIRKYTTLHKEKEKKHHNNKDKRKYEGQKSKKNLNLKRKGFIR